jgi:small subunit ribosomal protein S8
MQDFLGDMFARIKNGHRARLGVIVLHPGTSQLCLKILTLLVHEGYIQSFSEVSDKLKKNSYIRVYLKYDANGVPALQSIFRVSKPTRRVYLSLKALWKPRSTGGIFIVSTTAGLMSDYEARKRNLGGEIICGIY